MVLFRFIAEIKWRKRFFYKIKSQCVIRVSQLRWIGRGPKTFARTVGIMERLVPLFELKVSHRAECLASTNRVTVEGDMSFLDIKLTM